MKSSLKREIQRSSFSIFDIRDDTSIFAIAQESCKVLQCIIDAVTHEKNWLQLISTWEMNTWYHYDNMQMQQRLNVNQACSINMFQMKDRMKDDAMWREHHELKKASRNHECDDSDHLNDIFDKYTKSILDCDIIKKSDEREKE